MSIEDTSRQPGLPEDDNSQPERIEKKAELIKSKVLRFLQQELDSTHKDFSEFPGTPFNIEELPVEQRQELKRQKLNWEIHTLAKELNSTIQRLEPEFVAFLFDNLTTNISVWSLRDIVAYYLPRSSWSMGRDSMENTPKWQLMKTEQSVGYMFDSEKQPLKPEQAIKVMLESDKYKVAEVPGGEPQMRVLIITREEKNKG